MEQLKETIQKLLGLAGLEAGVDFEPDTHQVNIFFQNEETANFLPRLLYDLEHLIKIIAKKSGMEKVSVDVNNYKKERERLLMELAKAAARKVLAEKKDVELPAMNAYERRIVHVELATRPDVKTESVGEGPSRHIVVRPL